MVASGLRCTTTRGRFAGSTNAPDAERTTAALAAALEHLGTPAFVLSERGQVRSANTSGLRELTDDPELEAVLVSVVDDGCAAFALTPLWSEGTVVGFLAIRRRSSAPAPPSREERVDRAARRWALTPRQSQVLTLVAEGASNARIAAELEISERTAEDHVAAILLRAAVSTRSALLAELLQEEP